MKKVLFLYSKAFSFTGGIEKFNRSFLKALHELSVDGFLDAEAMSSYDTVTDEKYFSRKRFSGFGGKKIQFVLTTIRRSLSFDTVVLGHINLAVVGLLIKKIKPSVRLVLILHGIEAWETQTGSKKRLLTKIDQVLCVSNFTKQQLLNHNSFVPASKIFIFPNTIDPYFELPKTFEKPQYLLDRYGLTSDTKILLTVTRLSYTEKYKGYDNVISIINELGSISNQPFKYLVCGKADKQESERIEQLIDEFNVEEHIKLTGYIKDEELNDHYLLADVFIMTSKKEGFGIVFIEAMACGRTVIAGNKDGSVDALQNGLLGILVDPDSKDEQLKALKYALNDEFHNPLELQEKVIAAFGFHTYKERLKKYLCE
jgi:glycosyltransferase involved in cell wall biosynthesis